MQYGHGVICAFQSPRGDFGFLKLAENKHPKLTLGIVSIPSRGFWFFEVIPRDERHAEWLRLGFQSPRGDFGFLKLPISAISASPTVWVSIPSRGFWFFED